MSESTPDPTTDSIAGMKGPDGPLLRLIKDRRVAFILVGGINTVVGFVWLLIVTAIIHTWWPEGPSQPAWVSYATITAAWIPSILCAFVLYRKLVFRVTGHLWLDLSRFIVVSLPPILLNVFVVPTIVVLTGWPIILVQLVYTVIIALWNYFGHSRFSFHRKAESAADQKDLP